MCFSSAKFVPDESATGGLQAPAVGDVVSAGKAHKADIEVRGSVPWGACSDYATILQLHVKKFEGGAW
jgi:hypothetical protein